METLFGYLGGYYFMVHLCDTADDPYKIYHTVVWQ